MLTATSLVFLSHAGPDKAFTRQLAAGLAAHGVSVWFDEWDVEPGDSIPGRIEDGFLRCTHLVLVWSKAARESGWVTRERHAFLHTALKSGKTLIPLLLDNTPLPPLLADIKGVPVREVAEALDAMVGPGRDEREIRAAIVALAARRDELMVRGVEPGKYRCPKCGSNNVQTGSGDYNGRAFDVTTCGDCEEVLDVCI